MVREASRPARRAKKKIKVTLARLAEQLKIQTIDEGSTLEEFLQKNSIEYSAAVRVDGEPCDKDAILEGGDIITVIGKVSGGC